MDQSQVVAMMRKEGVYGIDSLRAHDFVRSRQYGRRESTLKRVADALETIRVNKKFESLGRRARDSENRDAEKEAKEAYRQYLAMETADQYFERFWNDHPLTGN